MNLKQALKVLGLPDSPTTPSVKKAYRGLALRYHPDRNENNPLALDRFREATEAYNFLVEHLKFPQPKTTARAKVASVSVVEDFEDIFDDIFGFTRQDRILGYQEPQKLEVTLFDLAFGGLKQVKLTAYEKCVFCKGNGAEKNTPVTICNYCFGAGQIKAGPVGEETFKLCPRCEGRGRKIARVCLVCKGFGRVGRMLTQQIKLPRGLIAGRSYTLHATVTKSGHATDLFIKPLLKTSPVFRVENSDILCEYPVAFSVAKKGGGMKLVWLWGMVAFKIPPGSRAGDEITVPGQGLPIAPGAKAHGSLRLRLVCLPDGEARERAALLETFIRQRGLPSAGFWNRLKSLFDL